MLAAGATGLTAAGATTPAVSQQEAAPLMRGQVVKGGEPVDTATVVLHRVGVDTAGEIDSVRAAADGSFRFELPTVPDPGGRGEVYFASVRYQDILYFGSALHRAVQLDTLYTIEVYDTAVVAAGGADLDVDVRYVVMEPAGDGWQVTDLFQVLNQGERTLVPGEEGRTVWSHPLPPGVRDVQVGGGDLPPDAVVYQGGALRVMAPVPPGERQFVVRYVAGDPALRFPLPGPTRQMELLIREPAPSLDVAGLTAAEPLEMDGGLTYRRYTATAVPAGAVVLTEVSGPATVPVRLLAVGVTLLLAVAGLWAYMRGRTPAPATASGGSAASGAGQPASRPPGLSGPEARRALLVQVARIDEALEAGDLDEGEAARLRGRRASLVRRLEAMT